MSPVLQNRKRNAESRPAKLHGNSSSEKYSDKSSESPINLLTVKGFTPGKSRVAITMGKDKSVLYGNVKRKLGMGTEKEVYEARFCLLINGKRYDRNYAISISRKPGSTLPPDPDGLYFGMTDTGASRVADGDLTHFMTKYPDIPTETLLNKLILPFLQIIKEKHAEKIIHADIKLQNALYMYKTEENEFKAEPSDWGMSQPIGALRRFCGTFDNIPPELYVQYKHTRFDIM